MTVYSLDLADKQERACRAELMANVRSATPDARFLLVGEIIDMDMHAKPTLKLLAAFLAGFNGELRP